MKNARKKELLPVLASRHFSFKTSGHVYSSYVEHNAPCQTDLAIDSQTSNICSRMTARAMIRQICNVKPQDIVTIRSKKLLARLGIEDLDLILKERRLCWYGHVERSNGAVKTAFDIQVDGKHGSGRPKMTWKQLTKEGLQRVEALSYRLS